MHPAAGGGSFGGRLSGASYAAAFPFPYAHVAFKISEEAEWFTANLAPGTSECGWVFNKTVYEALPQQYSDLLAKYRDLVLEVAQVAYAVADEKNLPVFEEKMTRIVYGDEQLAALAILALMCLGVGRSCCARSTMRPSPAISILSSSPWPRWRFSAPPIARGRARISA